jgi:hypothetical protein
MKLEKWNYGMGGEEKSQKIKKAKTRNTGTDTKNGDRKKFHPSRIFVVNNVVAV